MNSMSCIVIVTLRANFIITNLLCFCFVILICVCYTASLGARLTRVYDVIAFFLCLKLAWLQLGSFTSCSSVDSTTHSSLVAGRTVHTERTTRVITFNVLAP